MSNPVDFEKDKTPYLAFPGMGPTGEIPEKEIGSSEEDAAEMATLPLHELESAEEAGEWEDIEPLPAVREMGDPHISYIRLLLVRLSLAPPSDHEDILQEVLLQAYRSRESRLDPRALLWGITRHVAFRWFHKKQIERKAIRGFTSRQEDPAEPSSAESEWQTAERIEAVHAALEELPYPFREVFQRSVIDEVPMSQIAADQGVPLNTGYTRLHLARARFTEAFRRHMARRHIKEEDLCPLLVAGGLLGHGSLPAGGPCLSGPAAAHAGATGLGLLAHLPWMGAAAATVAAALLSVPPAAPSPAPSAVITAEAPPSAIWAGPSTTVSATQRPSAPLPGPSGAARLTPPSSVIPVASDVRSSLPSNFRRPLASDVPPSPPRESDGMMGRKVLKLVCSDHGVQARRLATELRKLYPDSSYILTTEEVLAKGRAADIDVEGCSGYRGRLRRK